MRRVIVYDPPQSCSTGACQPDAGEAVEQFAATLEALQKRGTEVARFDLGHQPGAFVQNRIVRAMLDREGLACLPLVMVDDQIVTRGGYPSCETLESVIAGKAAEATGHASDTWGYS